MSGPAAEDRAGLSAILAVRDGEPYLREAVESVLAQTRPVDELIVIDDGSTDGSAALAESFGDPVVCVRRPPRGLPGALNEGLELARGKLITFIDADDLWTPRRIELQAAAFEGDPELQLVFGGVEQFHSPELTEEQRARILNPTGPGRGLLRGCLMARASAFELVGPFDERWAIGEFVDWQARADEMGLPRAEIGEVVLRRRLHDGHMTRGPGGHADYARIVALARKRRHK